MTAAQIYILMQRNNCCEWMLMDYSNNKLCDHKSQECMAAVTALEDTLPAFAGYKRIQVLAKEDKDTTWAKAYKWQLEFAPSQPLEKAVAASSHSDTTIGAVQYVNMMKDMMSENFKLQTQLMEKTLAMNNNDPMKWVQAWQVVGPSLGFQTGGIAGSPKSVEQKKDLYFSDVELDKLTQEEIVEKIGVTCGQLAARVKGTQVLKVLILLNSNPDITSNVEKITKLLDAINNKPELLDTAMKFI